jgi:small subunit ribosomal protein S7
MNFKDKMVNLLMLSGKKVIAEKILSESLHRIKREYNKDPEEVFIKSIQHTRPSFEMRSIRIAGRTQQIPVPIKESKQIGLAMKWLVQSARVINKKSMAESLAQVLYDTYNGRGEAIRKRNELHKLVEANRAFAHYRWY